MLCWWGRDIHGIRCLLRRPGATDLCGGLGALGEHEVPPSPHRHPPPVALVGGVQGGPAHRAPMVPGALVEDGARRSRAILCEPAVTRPPVVLVAVARVVDLPDEETRPELGAPRILPRQGGGALLGKVIPPPDPLAVALGVDYIVPQLNLGQAPGLHRGDPGVEPDSVGAAGGRPVMTPGRHGSGPGADPPMVVTAPLPSPFPRSSVRRGALPLSDAPIGTTEGVRPRPP